MEKCGSSIKPESMPGTAPVCSSVELDASATYPVVAVFVVVVVATFVIVAYIGDLVSF